MNITLNPELEQLINAQLAMGEYNNIDDLLKDALLTLAEKRKRQSLSKKVRDLFDKTQSLVLLQKLLKSTSILYQSNFLGSDFKERLNKFFLGHTVPLIDTFYLTFINGVHNFNSSNCSPCCMKRLIS